MSNYGTITIKNKVYTLLTEAQVENKKDLSGPCVRATALNENKDEVCIEWEYLEDHGNDFSCIANWVSPIAIY